MALLINSGQRQDDVNRTQMYWLVDRNKLSIIAHMMQKTELSDCQSSLLINCVQMNVIS